MRAGPSCHHPHMLKIPGYDDGPLTLGDGYLTDPLFWPLHLYASSPGEEAQRAAYGVAKDAVMELYRKLSADDEWPMFTVPLASGHVIHVVYRNSEDEYGVDYLIHHPTWPEAEPLAAVDGHFMGPGLAWPELLSAAGQRPRAGKGVDDPNTRLLLLFPALGDAHLPPDAAAVLGTALAALTTVEAPAAVARSLLATQGLWVPAHWRSEADVLVNDGPHSYRNPANTFALPGERLREVSDALA